MVRLSIPPHEQAISEVAAKRHARLGAGAIERAIEAFPGRDLEAEGQRFRDYWIDGAGENRPIKDVGLAWRNWLKRAPSAATMQRVTSDRKAEASGSAQNERARATHSDRLAWARENLPDENPSAVAGAMAVLRLARVHEPTPEQVYARMRLSGSTREQVGS